MLRRASSTTMVLLALGLGEGQPLEAGEIAVVASIRPVHSLVTGVMQGAGEPDLLVRGASSPHDYSLRPSDARALDGAQVVFWIGDELETFLSKPLAALASDAVVVELSEAHGVELLATREGGLWGMDQRGGAKAGEHPAAAAQEEPHDRAELEDEPGHAHGAFDMHIWLDPRNAEAMVGAIVAALSEADPENAHLYRSNGGTLQARLRELDATLGTRLEPVQGRPFVVFHDAYRYLEARYGLNAVGAITVDPRRRPGARRLAEIQRSLEGVACVFFEPQFEPALVDIVIEGTGARKGVLDPLGADLEPGVDQYFDLMNGLADSLIDCLGS